MTATEKYIRILASLKSGELGLLRRHAGERLDRSLEGFDLFTGLWWPLRQQNERAPRREVAWLVAKLYASCPLQQSEDGFARQLGKCRPAADDARFQQRVDKLLTSQLSQLEPDLRWALCVLADRDLKVNWVKLTDDLSVWEWESTRLKWAEQYLYEGRK